jgi:hypothetical protein
VTAVIVDEELIASSPATRRPSGTPSRSTSARRPSWRTLLDLESGPAARGALDAQPPAAVRRRRDLAHLGDDDDPDALGELQSRARHDGRAGREVCERPASTPEQVYEITVCGNVT